MKNTDNKISLLDIIGSDTFKQIAQHELKLIRKGRQQAKVEARLSPISIASMEWKHQAYLTGITS